MFTTEEMLNIVRQQLSIDMNCIEKNFIEEGITFCEAVPRTGRRPFDRQEPFLEIATMGKGIVVSGDKEILDKVKLPLKNTNREDIFAVPYLYGHTLGYIPDINYIKEVEAIEGYSYGVLEGKYVFQLYETPGFENAVSYDTKYARPDVIAAYCKFDNEIIGVAGATEDCSKMWQIGVDVNPKYRRKGIAKFLVSNIAMKILKKDIVPYYCTASSNIGSQMVAHSSGFMPAWVSTYKNRFDDSASLNKFDYEYELE